MRKVRQMRAKVVQGVVSARASINRENPSAPPVAAQSVQRSSPGRCPICRKRAGVTEVMLGVLIVRVCDPCADPVMKGLDFFAALSRLY